MKRKLIKPRLKTKQQSNKGFIPFWSEIINILTTKYQYNYAQIAMEINVPIAIVEQLADKRSSSPSYEVFDRLVRLYHKTCT